MGGSPDPDEGNSAQVGLPPALRAAVPEEVKVDGVEVPSNEEVLGSKSAIMVHCRVD
jgi:hypothetical protein